MVFADLDMRVATGREGLSEIKSKRKVSDLLLVALQTLYAVLF